MRDRYPDADPDDRLTLFSDELSALSDLEDVLVTTEGGIRLEVSVTPPSKETSDEGDR